MIKIPEVAANRWKEILENAIAHLMVNKLADDGWEGRDKPQQNYLFFGMSFP